ncbi:KpsF/GutQ family sugar-phosphate isomerase [Cohnella sp. CFH 77786]|uniref:KpsF/GutQ family sugar-phosphate isomerase n=1 Tax=Cohnella sp. CFH 77786 TaxID=2662265 RepID=UPI001C60F65F|nr:KpsF/GutQ family sugar-phosphate isomerase [Cohnella sp. CFH 77786]MBW5448505.1 KpsF/GutQ family sugar-phosphate isomerase [Cohnella sp. CFH 77786]
MTYVSEAKEVFEKEIAALKLVKDQLGDEFDLLIEMILQSEGRVILTGVGKSGLISRKISATLSSLGTPSYFLHPTEAVHGDLGLIRKEDLVIAVSNSGETDELLQIIPSIKNIGAKLIAVTGKQHSSIAVYSDLNIVLQIPEEACYYNLAPTSSTTVSLVFGDALAIVLSKTIGFNKDHFALFHPKGTLGKRLLLKVEDLMYKGDDVPIIHLHTDFREVIFEMNSKSLKMVNVVDNEGRLLGIITDGDVRRSLYKSDIISDIRVSDIYQKNPVVALEHELAVEAMKKMIREQLPFSFLPVVDHKGYLKGVITFIDIAKKGINV